MPNEQVSISVADAFLDRFADVVKRIEQAGLKVDQQLDTIGVITGSIDSDDIGKLDQVEGVAAVERSRGFQLPPPDSSIQ